LEYGQRILLWCESHAPLVVMSQNATETRSTDVGASQMIIDGKIKLKNDAQISRFTEKGLEFDNGSSLDADTVIFATGWVPCSFMFIVSFHFFFPW
jgi:hypothetical protein